MYLRASVVILVPFAFAACENDPRPADEIVSITKSEPTPRPPLPEVQEPVDLSLGEGVELGRPIHDGRLTLIPIVATRAPANAQKFITLNEGMANGTVTVREVAQDLEVDQLVLHNGSKDRLVALRGELVIEGEQDRVMSTDRVIEPGQTVVVNVRCVEIDRDGGSLYFRGGKAMAELSLRRAVAYEPQENVWGQVDVINARQGLHPSTKTYRYAAQAQVKGANLARRDDILAQLGRREEHAHMLGVAVAVDNEIVAVERYATPELYRQLEPELLASYVIATDGKAREGKALTPTDVRAFIASVKPSTTAASTVQLKARPARERVAYDYASD